MKNKIDTTMENTSYSSSTKMEPSKPWIEIARLGQRIIHELGINKDVSVLERWIAHRVAELIVRVESATETSVRESAAKECENLILKLWSKRNSWPSGGPLFPIMPTLNRLFSSPDSYYHTFFDKYSDTSGLIGKLMRLHEREMQLFLSSPNVAVSKEAADASAEKLELFADELTDDERKALLFAIKNSNKPDAADEITSEMKHEELQTLINQSKDNFERLAKDREKLIQQVLRPNSGEHEKGYNPFK